MVRSSSFSSTNLGRGLIFLIGLSLVACTPAPASQIDPTEPVVGLAPTATSIKPDGEATPDEIAVAEPEVAVSHLIQPYPFTTPLPPPTPTLLDGVYARTVKYTGTPTPCRRCAPYRADGGTWLLTLEAGVFRVSHAGTGFSGVGSFTVSGNQLILFNDPNCHLDTGTYTWELEGRSLRLTEVDDSCAWELRAHNLTSGSWLLEGDGQGTVIDHCQPPSTEAAISGHWRAPAGC